MDGMLDKLADALVSRRGNGHDGNAQLLLEHVDIDGAAVGSYLIHHVESDDRRAIKLDKLQREI